MGGLLVVHHLYAGDRYKGVCLGVARGLLGIPLMTNCGIQISLNQQRAPQGGGLARDGVPRTPTSTAQNDAHNALTILMYVARGRLLFYKTISCQVTSQH